MKLVGAFLGSKSGIFKPEDSPEERIPWVFAKIRDEDAEGGYVKVKPASGDDEDVAELQEVVKGLSKGEVVAWTVVVEQSGKFSTVRYQGDAA